MPELPEHALEDVVWLRARDQQPAVEEPGRHAAHPELERPARLSVESFEVGAVSHGIEDLGLLQAHRSPLLHQHALVADVTPPRPVRVEKPWMEVVEDTALSRVFAEYQRFA